MHTQESGKGMKKLRNNKIRKLLAFMVALALMVSCMPSAYTISASEAFGDGTEDIFTDGEITSEPAAEESTPDVSSADQEETEQAQQSTLTYENDSVKVTAEALEDGALPQNTALKADGVNENSSVSYDTVSQKLSAAATDKGSSLRGFFAYDVYFADGDGNRVEPNGRVRVTFEYKTPAAPELTDAASTSVTVEKLHYNSSTGDTDVNTLQANEDLKVLNVNEGKQIQTLQVETGNAAVFAVMWDSPETADVEAEAVSGNGDEVSIASEELTEGVDISDEPEQDAAETPAAENPEVTPEAEPSEEPAENPDAEPTEAPAEDPDVVEEPAEDIESPEDVPAADENGETSLIEVLGDDTNLRVSPSVEAEVLATVNAGTQLTLLDTVTAEDGATWYKVSWEGTEAYIRSDMAQVVDSSDEAEEPEDVQESEEVSYSQEVGNVVVTATAAKGVIPEGAQFVVTPIEKGSDQYADIEKQLHEGAENESYTVAGFLAYDISFLNDDGTKIEPQNGSVRVSIAYKEAEIPEDVAETDTAQENMNVSLVHFVEDANGNVTEVVNMSNDGQAEVSTTDNGEIESANFETESFSTFSVVWLADNFTSVQTTSSYGVEETVDSAKRGITINMFNYNTDEINAGHSLQFSNGQDGVWEDYNKYRGPEVLSLGIMQKRLGEDSYPIVDKGKEESSSYLFSTKEGTGKEFYSDANYLFKQDADGYYEYDSAKNFAQFNKNTKEFTVYEVPGSSTDPIDLQQPGPYHGSFFPFNTLGDKYYKDIPQISEKSPDFHFGMTMSAKFIQPKDGKIKGNNMVFEFSGDDDVWVYIDGVLVLDIGGIHNVVSGSINFADGTVTFGNNNTDLKTLFKNANREGDFVSEKSIFKDYTAHTINFYYLERGKGDSNCKLKFNLPTVPKKSVTVEKQLSNTDKEKYANVEFKFQLLLQDDKGEYVPSNTAGTLSDDSKVEFNREEINGVSYDNVFTLKPGQKAIFSGLEENKNYKVRELGVSKDRYDQVLINGKETTNDNGNVISKKATVGSRPVVVVTNVLASVAELDLKKVNKDQNALSGAQFTLVNSATKESKVATSLDETGLVKFTRLRPGTYTLTEDVAPNGYEVSNESWIVKVELSADNKAVATLYKADSKTKIEKESDSLYHIMNYTQEEIIESSMDYSKTATVNDWDKRTYDINITADSKVTSGTIVEKDPVADIMMVFDTSGSMLYNNWDSDYEGFESVGRFNDISTSLDTSKIYYYGNGIYHYGSYGNVQYPMIYLNDLDQWIYYDQSRWSKVPSDSSTKIYTLDSGLNGLKEAANAFIASTATSSPKSRIGLATFNSSGDLKQELTEVGSSKDSLIKTTDSIYAAGGTSPQEGLKIAANQLTTKQEDVSRYVILFTDGDPSFYKDKTKSEKEAKKLRDAGIKVFTIGLKLNGTTEEWLSNKIASKGCAFEASSIDELKVIFEKIQQTITQKVEISGAEIKDVIDPRFVIVGDDGNPITNEMIKAAEDSGKPIQLGNGGILSVDSAGNQVVKWTDQTIPNIADGKWNKTITVKAKEEFIGGNSISTNVYPDSKITTGYGEAILPQPSVNVKLLSLDIGNDETTVFKGDQIDPTGYKDELAKTLKVKELDGTTTTITGVNPIDGESAAFPTLSSDQKDELLRNATITLGDKKSSDGKYPYEYIYPGTTDAGGYFTYTYKVSETPGGNMKPHKATTVGTAVEKYELVVTYHPYSQDERKNILSGTQVQQPDAEKGGTQVNSNLEATGNYVVNVVAGNIQIIKKLDVAAEQDETFNFTITDENNRTVATATATIKKDEPKATATAVFKLAEGVNAKLESDDTKLSELSRGNYKVVESLGADVHYELQEIATVDGTNCYSVIARNQQQKATDITFTMGTNTDSNVVLRDGNDDITNGQIGIAEFTNKKTVVNINLEKVDSQTADTKLSGAKFDLYKADANGEKTDQAICSYTSGRHGAISIENLPIGQYVLIETEAPTGYMVSAKPWNIVVENDRTVTVTYNGEDVTPREDNDTIYYQITNTKLYSLPESGGPGTYGFTISGVAILATALLLFINNKRREEEAKRS